MGAHEQRGTRGGKVTAPGPQLGVGSQVGEGAGARPQVSGSLPGLSLTFGYLHPGLQRTLGSGSGCHGDRPPSSRQNAAASAFHRTRRARPRPLLPTAQARERGACAQTRLSHVPLRTWLSWAGTQVAGGQWPLVWRGWVGQPSCCVPAAANRVTPLLQAPAGPSAFAPCWQPWQSGRPSLALRCALWCRAERGWG